MGNTLWVTFQRDGEIEHIHDDHSIMCRLDRQLDRIARRLDVTPLSDFVDGSDMAAEFIDDFEVDEDISLPEPQWYDAGEGLKTVEALLEHISQNPELFTFPDDPSRSHWRADLIEELTRCQSLLSTARAEGLPFHFAIIM